MTGTIFTLLQACHRKLATRDLLRRFGMLTQSTCSFCQLEETHDHIFFECEETKKIWKVVLNWIQIDHDPTSWQEEVTWLVNKTKGKGRNVAITGLAIIETIYGVWRHMNEVCFGSRQNRDSIIRNIIDTIIYRGWYTKLLRAHIAILMM